MTPEDRYHFEPLLLSVESAIGRGETVGQYHHSEVLRLLRAALPQPATEPALDDDAHAILVRLVPGAVSPSAAVRAIAARLAAQPSAEVERLRAIVDEWEQTADRVADRALVGDPGAALAAAATLRDCASTLRAALAESGHD